MAEHMNVTQICVTESLEWCERIRVSVKGVKIVGFGATVHLDGKWLFEEGCFGSFENLSFTNSKFELLECKSIVHSTCDSSS